MKDKTESKRKTMAMMLIFFLALMYKETIFDPYFVGPKNQQASVVESSGNQASQSQTTNQVIRNTENTELKVFSQSQSEEGASSVVSASNSAYPPNQLIAESGFVIVENSDFIMKLSLLGGRVEELDLKGYREELDLESKFLNLVVHRDGTPLPLGVYSGEESDVWTEYKVVFAQGFAEQGGRYLVQSEASSLVLEGVLKSGRKIKKSFKFSPNGHLADLRVRLSEATADSSRLELEWTKYVEDTGSAIFDPYNSSGFVWFDGESKEAEQFSGVDSPVRSLGPINWLSVAEKYFMATILPIDGSAPAKLVSASISEDSKVFGARVNGGDTVGDFRLFIGPKSYRDLEEIGEKLHLNVDFGYTAFVAAPLLKLLLLFYDLVGNYGLAIILLTILVKAVLYPLSAAQFKQMKAMQELAPEMKRIREKTSDKREQQMAMMDLYKKKGVNPMGGCVPLLVQMPVFIGLYSALLLAIELRHSPFAFWINDLSAPEELMIAGIGIPVMVILFVISMMVQQWITPSQADPMQKKIMLVMPIVFGFMFASFPAGLTLYWLTNNLISIAQTRSLHQSKPGKFQGMRVTAIVSAAIFAIAFVMVKLG